MFQLALNFAVVIFLLNVSCFKIRDQNILVPKTNMPLMSFGKKKELSVSISSPFYIRPQFPRHILCDTAGRNMSAHEILEVSFSSESILKAEN